MRSLVILFALVALGSAAPQSRKLFHEHFEDFLDVIDQEVSAELKDLIEEYAEFEDFRISLDYMATAEFKTLIFEMQDLPEFKAMVEFLEKNNIDISYFLDIFNKNLEMAVEPREHSRGSGKTVTDYINDKITILPKEKLNALFEEKKDTDEGFRVTIENLYSEEWQKILSDLWNSEKFLQEVQIFHEHGIDVDMLLLQIKAYFGQN